MCAVVGLMVPRRPLVAVFSYDEKALVWTLLIESTCSRDLYKLLWLRQLVWAQWVVFQDLYNVWALLQPNKGKAFVSVLDRPPARLWTIFARVDLGLQKSVCLSVLSVCLSVCVCATVLGEALPTVCLFETLTSALMSLRSHSAVKLSNVSPFQPPVSVPVPNVTLGRRWADNFTL